MESFITPIQQQIRESGGGEESEEKEEEEEEALSSAEERERRSAAAISRISHICHICHICHISRRGEKVSLWERRFVTMLAAPRRAARIKSRPSRQNTPLPNCCHKAGPAVVRTWRGSHRSVGGCRFGSFHCNFVSASVAQRHRGGALRSAAAGGDPGWFLCASCCAITGLHSGPSWVPL